MIQKNFNKSRFNEMLDRYLKGQSTPDELKYIENWYKKLGNDAKLDLTDQQQIEIEQRLWKNINSRIHKKGETVNTAAVKPVSINYWRVTGIAAALVIGLSVLFYLQYAPSNLTESQLTSKSGQVDDGSNAISNTTQQVKEVTLPDGTVIALEPGSKLSVKQFQVNKREVSLEGKAFFEVAHDKRRPFYVYTGDITTRVLGTSFTINAVSEKAVEVIVKTGKVSVTKHQKKSTTPLHVVTEEVILTPNQMAIYDGNSVMTVVVNEPKINVTQDTNVSMEFDEEPVIQILEAIAEAYRVDIVYDEEQLQACKLTTAFLDENLYDRLKIISKAIHGSYELDGDKIIVKSKGCN